MYLLCYELTHYKKVFSAKTDAQYTTLDFFFFIPLSCKPIIFLIIVCRC